MQGRTFFLTVLFSFFSIATFANEIVGSQAPVLTKTQVSAESLAYLQKRCAAETGVLTLTKKSVCDKVAAESLLTQTNFDYCKDRGQNISELVSCLKDLSGRAYPLEYIDVCRKVREDSGHLSGFKICLDYLAQTDSTFDSEGFKLCVDANDRRIDYAKGCLNAIRDRNVDVQKLKSACVDHRWFSEQLDTCVARETDKAPSSSACAKKPSYKNPKSNGSPQAPGAR